MAGGLTYASYNIVGAVIILPVLRHLTSQRDAVVAGMIAGPLTMLPAILFFVAMMAFYPAIGSATLQSDFMLRQLAIPGFQDRKGVVSGQCVAVRVVHGGGRCI